MYYLYIIKSLSVNNWRYIGISDDVEKRLRQHNSGKTRSTKAYVPFKIIYTENFPDKSSARGREIYLKKSYTAREEIFKNL